jgi:hypothetical protein
VQAGRHGNFGLVIGSHARATPRSCGTMARIW